MNLYFEHSDGTYSLVKSNVDSFETGLGLIELDVRKRNPDFRIYYFNITDMPDGGKRFDVGSHTEFYILTPNTLL